MVFRKKDGTGIGLFSSSDKVKKQFHFSNMSRDWLPDTRGHLEKGKRPVTTGEGAIQ